MAKLKVVSIKELEPFSIFVNGWQIDIKSPQFIEEYIEKHEWFIKFNHRFMSISKISNLPYGQMQRIRDPHWPVYDLGKKWSIIHTKND